ncbi:MAG: hypothetical protein LW716_19840 [Microcystis sp. 53602_E8]|uniref:Uncharacterized protein n=1 Tax=Microcystis flos-aquae Mf_QC_C_20070823_S10D TaxID=2486236 RepID=A0A552L244_9CHRO|nr:hypothetical protein [Microcystis sp. M53602_WE12]MCE2664832.1 hypothetical protein [Microcystis sp. 53602_E8]ROI03101.1 hypothetical protein ED562_12000 [Microcystis aeruginosa FACHB-524]TRT98665.1 MAG: hypothetical protein EWV65_09215 [Microcystis flos-aquae Ma_QC_C_20070823_S18D]TRV14291.1 MAG: hypothetical protein EWV45_05640 [Microcystis flos-aquae Mf_QC_C_20070823_S10D]TRV28126.1 MAG: hypothetical protein EWV72_03435 [Microcystis flos-aquae Mf_QC_C_20070823_S10]TRV35211.1 MAG: hypoth
MFSPAIIHLNEDKRNYSRRQEAGGSFILPTPHTPHPTPHTPFFPFSSYNALFSPRNLGLYSYSLLSSALFLL